MRVHLGRKGFEAAKALSYFCLALVLLRVVQYAQERCPAALYGSGFEDTFLSPLLNYNTHCHTGSDVTIEFIYKECGNGEVEDINQFVMRCAYVVKERERLESLMSSRVEGWDELGENEKVLRVLDRACSGETENTGVHN